MNKKESVKRTVGAMIAAALGVTIAWTAWTVANEPSPAATDNQAIVQAVEPRAEVIDLPEDGNTYHVSVFVHSDWRARARDRSLVAWWDAESRLKSVKAAAHYHLYTPADPIFRTRFARTVVVLPAVMIQDATGKVHYKASGENLPTTAVEQGDEVEKLFKNRPYYILPWRRPKPCPEPGPEPGPEPPLVPDTPVHDPVIPDTTVVVQPAVPEPAAPEFPFGLLAAAVGIAGAGAVIYCVRKEAAG